MRRPPNRIEPGPDQESVWDYPRPPALELTAKHLRVARGKKVIAETRRGYRVLETSHPPVYYFPPEDVRWDILEEVDGGSFCEWKGRATYFDVCLPPEDSSQRAKRLSKVAWCYAGPTARFSAMAGYVAFYPAQFICTVDGEPVEPQPGGFYGGWVTSDIVGPIKGEPGTEFW